MSLLPEYEQAVHECWQEGVDIIMRASDPVLGGMPPMVRTPHVPATGTTPETSIGYQGELQPIEGTVEFNVGEFLNLDLSAWDEAVFKCAQSALPQVMSMVFGSLDEATRQSGNVVDAKGKKLSHDVILDGLEAMELDFNEDGTHKELRMIVSPGMFEAFKKLGPPTPEQEARHRDIVQKKWEAHLARRRFRKLDK
jgi:hypothetical protein